MWPPSRLWWLSKRIVHRLVAGINIFIILPFFDEKRRSKSTSSQIDRGNESNIYPKFSSEVESEFDPVHFRAQTKMGLKLELLARLDVFRPQVPHLVRAC